MMLGNEAGDARPTPTTTHDPGNGGGPRLVLAPGQAAPPGAQQRVFPLRPDVTTVGSADGCDLRLDGLAGRHAEIRRDGSDEFYFVQLSRVQGSQVNGEPADEARLLRTSARIEMGGWTLSYYREEYADHGRPYGGRVGGEIGHQLPQPPRQRLDDHAPSGPRAARRGREGRGS